MAYLHKWSPISHKLSAGQQKHIGQRPMLYRWTTQPTARRAHCGSYSIALRAYENCRGDIFGIERGLQNLGRKANTLTVKSHKNGAVKREFFKIALITAINFLNHALIVF